MICVVCYVGTLEERGTMCIGCMLCVLCAVCFALWYVQCAVYVGALDEELGKRHIIVIRCALAGSLPHFSLPSCHHKLIKLIFIFITVDCQRNVSSF